MSDQQPGYGGYDAGGYGAGYGGYDPGGYGYGGYGYGPDPRVKSQATMAFVFNIIACLLCCGVASLPGLICGGVAMSKAELDPEGARSLTRWAWICLGVTIGIAVLLIVGYVVVAIATNGFEDVD